MEARHQGVKECQDVDNRELGVGIPAEPHQREEQVDASDPRKQRRPLHQPVLEEEDQGQHEHGSHRDRHRHPVHLHIFTQGLAFRDRLGGCCLFGDAWLDRRRRCCGLDGHMGVRQDIAQIVR